MIDENLFEKILLVPAEKGADTLYIVSGYAAPTMATLHMEKLKKARQRIDIRLIVGMCAADGLAKSSHEGFQNLCSGNLWGGFECRYVVRNAPVHSKIYSWFKKNSPFAAFAGSANYTQQAFGRIWRESMAESDPEKSYRYYQKIFPDTAGCLDSDIGSMINIYEPARPRIRQRATPPGAASDMFADPESPSVNISFLDNKGDLPPKSGLNWAHEERQRQYNRNPNEAYIRVPARIYNTDFFPEKGKHFTVLTDDGKNLICVRAQQNGKAIETPLDNSRMGEYFRNRLGLDYGARIVKENLELYGRTHVDFYKIDDETYLMDFSPA